MEIWGGFLWTLGEFYQWPHPLLLKFWPISPPGHHFLHLCGINNTKFLNFVLPCPKPRYTTYLTNESNIDNLYIFDRPYSIFTSISRYLGCLSRKVFFFMSSSSYIFPTHLTFSSYRRAVGTKYGGSPLGSQILAGKEIQSLLRQKALNHYLPHQIFRYSYGPA